MPKSHRQQPSIRIRKINSLLREKLSSYFYQNEIPELHGLLTITGVEATPDLKEAKVWFSSLNQNQEEVLKILNSNLGKIQKALFHGSSTRVTPKIRFVINHALSYAQHIDELLNKVKNDE